MKGGEPAAYLRLFGYHLQIYAAEQAPLYGIPVSYTHLDVYKRQANARVVDGETLAAVGDGGYTLGARAAQIRDDLQAKQRFDEHDLLAVQLDDRAAVSYTHLDVYKRQDLMRRSAAGELAALVGPLALDVDKQRRLHRLRARVEQDLPLIVADKRPQLDAYVAGVNAGLAALRARPWPYLLLREAPQLSLIHI